MGRLRAPLKGSERGRKGVDTRAGAAIDDEIVIGGGDGVGSTSHRNSEEEDDGEEEAKGILDHGFGWSLPASRLAAACPCRQAVRSNTHRGARSRASTDSPTSLLTMIGKRLDLLNVIAVGDGGIPASTTMACHLKLSSSCGGGAGGRGRLPDRPAIRPTAREPGRASVPRLRSVGDRRCASHRGCHRRTPGYPGVGLRA